MKRFMTIFLLSLATAVPAGEVKIVETESGIIVEYAGSPSSTGIDSEIPAAVAGNDNATEVNSITAQEALAAEKKQQIELYEEKIRQVSAKPQTEAVQKDAPRPATQRENIRRFKEQRQLRRSSSGGSASE